MSPASTTSNSSGDSTTNHDATPRLVHVPARSSSSDVGKRIVTPSPLSKPVNMTAEPAATPAATEPSAKTASTSATPPALSPAAQHLAALNDKSGKSKNKTSRLRRAFSFGSAAELRKATGQDIAQDGGNADSIAGKAQLDPASEDPYEAEQARIAQKQEAGGIGSSIYSGTKLFSNSNDNLSISSTASSASIMLRKMGRGMKKGGRSLKGLFRPKSVIGVPSSDAVINDPSRPAVTMVTVEAERERPDTSGGTQGQYAGSSLRPRSDKSLLDVGKSDERLGSSGTDTSGPRKSIVGGEKERAEVLATIRKGILKCKFSGLKPCI